MEIKIDERLVDVFNEVVEKDDKPFNGEKNLEKAINTNFAKFLCFIFNKNGSLLSQKSVNKLFDFVVEDEEIVDGEETSEEERVLKALLKVLLPGLGK